MSIRTLALSPLILPQAVWVAARATRLPEAAGERVGQKGTGPSLRLLVLGDSSAAGVGVAAQSEALGGRLTDKLAERYSVKWSIVARSGGTVRSTLGILEDLPEEGFDVAIVALGVNDAKNGVTVNAWRSRYRQLLHALSTKFGIECVCVSGLPPIGRFPVLPTPLNRVLGDRALLFDDCLREIALELPQVIYLPLDFKLDASKMVSDGFHPGPEIYAAWADGASDALKDALAKSDNWQSK